MKLRTHLLFLLLYSNILYAQNIDIQDSRTLTFGADNEQLSQKFGMAYNFLNLDQIQKRMTSGHSQQASQLLKNAVSNYRLASKRVKVRNWLEANAIIDSVLRDITTSSQLSNKKSIAQSAYQENLKRVEAFSFPKWHGLSEQDKTALAMATAENKKLLGRARKSAATKNYDTANKVLSEVYYNKTKLLRRLKHENTITYSLSFDSPQAEFEYLLKRNQHFLEMIEDILTANHFEDQTLKLINVLVKRSKTAIRKGRALIASNQATQAIQVVNGSIDNLSNVLILMGVKI